MKRRTLLVLGAGLGQVPMIRAALEDGLDVVAVDPRRDAPGLAIAGHAYCHDLADTPAIVGIARRHAVDGVATLGADYPMPVLAEVCDLLGLPGPGVESVHLATNKRLMRKAFASAGVGSPRSIAVDTVHDAAMALRRIGVDCIVKPAMSQGGRGITRVATGAGAAEIGNAFRHAMDATREDAVLVEEFVDGPEFSVEAITWRGTTRVVAVTDKLTSGPPHFVELGHSQPTAVVGADLGALHATATAAVKALGIDDAASHTEIRLGATGPRIMESAARLGGGFINSHLVPASCGVDIVRAAIAIALGQEPDLAPGTVRGAAIRFVTAAPGRVESVDGLEIARRMPGVMEAVSYVSTGDQVGALRDASGRLGHVIATGSNAGEAVRRAQAALATIGVRTQPVARAVLND